MKSSDVADALAEIDELEAKKRLGKNQKQRLANLKAVAARAPWVTPRKQPREGVRHPFDYDHDGSRWRTRLQPKPAGARQARRASRFGRNGIRPFRSRIQRTTRKQRTGGVK